MTEYERFISNKGGRKMKYTKDTEIIRERQSLADEIEAAAYNWQNMTTADVAFDDILDDVITCYNENYEPTELDPDDPNNETLTLYELAERIFNRI